MICLMDSQVRLSVAGSCASAFQKLLIQSVFRVAMMSSKTARTSGVSIFDQAGGRHAGILPIADTPERLTENDPAGDEPPRARPQAVSAARIVRWGRLPRVGAGGEYRAKASVLRSLYLSPPLVQNRFPLPRRSSSRCGRPRPTTSGTDLAPCRIDAAGHNPRNAPTQRPISVSSYRPAAWMERRCSSSLLSSRYPESD